MLARLRFLNGGKSEMDIFNLAEHAMPMVNRSINNFVAFLLLFLWRTPPWLVVILCAAGGELLAFLP